MQFNGDLSDRSVEDLLTAVAESAESGKLRLSRRDGEAVVLFDRGRINYAATRAGRETFGSILIAQKLITPGQLATALELQQTMEGRSLGSILVDLNVLSKEAVRQAVREQIAQVLADLLTWKNGHYEFQPMPVTLAEYTSLPLSELLPGAARSVAPRAGIEPTPAIPSEAPPAPAPDPKPTTTTTTESHLDLLREISMTIRSPEITGELVTRILERARQTLDRAVLFLVRPDGFQGISQHGVDREGSDGHQSVRELFVPADLPSILQAATDRHATVRQSLAEDDGDALLVGSLGGDPPPEAVAIPMTAAGRVLGLLYGDKAPSGEPIGSLDDLELEMMEAGMSMERGLLQKRHDRYDSLRQVAGQSVTSETKES